MKVTFYPTGRTPYQELLATSLAKYFKVEINFMNGKDPKFYVNSLGLLLFIPRIIMLRLLGYKILHLHWVYFYLPVYFAPRQKSAVCRIVRADPYYKLHHQRRHWAIPVRFSTTLYLYHLGDDICYGCYCLVGMG